MIAKTAAVMATLNVSVRFVRSPTATPIDSATHSLAHWEDFRSSAQSERRAPAASTALAELNDSRLARGTAPRNTKREKPSIGSPAHQYPRWLQIGIECGVRPAPFGLLLGQKRTFR